ncbi:unnamed protein product, partial [Didymodactylos carnosus]
MSKFLAEAVPGYRPPHRNQIQRELKRLHSVYMSQLKQKLIDVRSMALTTDLWSDRKNRSYLCLTGHSLDNDMTMQSTIIHFQTFDDRHLAANIGAEVKSRLRELDVEHKTTTITSDGGSNIRAACATHLKISRVWCVAHRFHLTVCNGLGLWKKFLKKETDNSDQYGVIDSQISVDSSDSQDPDEEIMETSDESAGEEGDEDEDEDEDRANNDLIHDRWSEEVITADDSPMDVDDNDSEQLEITKT